MPKENGAIYHYHINFAGNYKRCNLIFYVILIALREQQNNKIDAKNNNEKRKKNI